MRPGFSFTSIRRDSPFGAGAPRKKESHVAHRQTVGATFWREDGGRAGDGRNAKVRPAFKRIFRTEP
jgi:hypothetical protein